MWRRALTKIPIFGKLFQVHQRTQAVVGKATVTADRADKLAREYRDLRRGIYRR